MSDWGPWEPMRPQEVVELFGAAPPATPWWIAGGYAIELFVGRPLRQHGDIDVLLLRRDQQVVHQVLPGWDIHAADPPGQLRPWLPGVTLPTSVHDIWCRESPSGPWRLQVMLDDADGETWRSRRSPAVTRGICDLGSTTADGWPYLTPEVQLSYKAKPAHQLEKDEVDFAAALPLLDGRARLWLDRALGATLPGHHWRDALGVAAQALVVVDLQRAFVLGDEAVPDADSLTTAVRTQLDGARSAGCLVVHLQNDGAPGAPDETGTNGWELALPVRPGEPVLRKTRDDGFDGTDLEDLLEAAGVRTLSICGVMSEMCVAATARGALTRGYGVTMARDAHATYPVPEQGPLAPPVPAHLVSRVAEWSLGDEASVVDRSAGLPFARAARPASRLER